MKRLVVLLAAAALLMPLAARAHSSMTLNGIVGPGFTIDVKTLSGKDVTKLTPGTYTFRIQDRSGIHNFHLIGPGVNKKTSVGFTGKATWTVRLRRGTYTYQCDPHAASGMKGKFRVT